MGDRRALGVGKSLFDFTPVIFTWRGAKSRNLTISVSPKGGSYTRALKMMLLPHFPVGGWGKGQWLQMTSA